MCINFLSPFGYLIDGVNNNNNNPMACGKPSSSTPNLQSSKGSIDKIGLTRELL